MSAEPETEADSGATPGPTRRGPRAAWAAMPGPGRVLVVLVSISALAAIVPWLAVGAGLLGVRTSHATVFFILLAVYGLIVVERALAGRPDLAGSAPELPQSGDGAPGAPDPATRLADAGTRLWDPTSGETRREGARALIALADEWPDGRQSCIDVLCEYVRRPVVREDGVAVIIQQAIIDHLPLRHAAPDQVEGGGEVEVDVIDGPSWSDRSFDLRGAELVDWDSSFAVIPARMVFSRATFAGDTCFRDCRFTGPAAFTGATFKGPASFESAVIPGSALFKDAVFQGRADFDFVRFAGRAFFPRVHFWQRADFNAATFGGPADLNGVDFGGDASFDGATFADSAGLTDSRFGGAVSFCETTFEQVNGGRVRFPPAAALQDARFRRPDEARFIGVTGLAPAEVEWLTARGIQVVSADGPA